MRPRLGWFFYRKSWHPSCSLPSRAWVSRPWTRLTPGRLSLQASSSRVSQPHDPSSPPSMPPVQWSPPPFLIRLFSSASCRQVCTPRLWTGPQALSLPPRGCSVHAFDFLVLDATSGSSGTLGCSLSPIPGLPSLTARPPLPAFPIIHDSFPDPSKPTHQCVLAGTWVPP